MGENRSRTKAEMRGSGLACGGQRSKMGKKFGADGLLRPWSGGRGGCTFRAPLVRILLRAHWLRASGAACYAGVAFHSTTLASTSLASAQRTSQIHLRGSPALIDWRLLPHHSALFPNDASITSRSLPPSAFLHATAFLFLVSHPAGDAPTSVTAVRPLHHSTLCQG